MAADPLSLRAYLALTWFVPPLAKVILRRRLRKGKEDPARFKEKLGRQSKARPDGPLIWINAVGLGEVLSLRGLIASLTKHNPEAHVLVTSTTRDSAKVFGANRPERTFHQYLPIDTPQFRKLFLDHWRPNIAIWAEQDVWPGFVVEIDKRQIPQAIVASRMDDQALKSRRRAPRLAQAIFRRMAFVTAQDERTAKNLGELGAINVNITGSIKPAAPPLSVEAKQLSWATNAVEGRFVWSVISSYPEDEQVALKAHEILRKDFPNALLIVAPRQIGRDFARFEMAPRLSKSQSPGLGDSVWLADTIGEIGLVLRLSKATLIGGTFSSIEGHNPWEAVALGVPNFHGPRTNNFKSDFLALDNERCSHLVATAEELASGLAMNDLELMARTARKLLETHTKSVEALARRLTELMDD